MDSLEDARGLHNLFINLQERGTEKQPKEVPSKRSPRLQDPGSPVYSGKMEFAMD